MDRSLGKRQLLINITVLFVTLCIMLVAAEVLVRTFSVGPKEEKWVGADKRWYEYDPLYGWRKIPGIATTRVSTKGMNSVFFRINSRGFRGPEYPYEKPENEYRILFLGDSFTEGFMLTEEDHFAEIMKRKLNNMKSKMHFEALNSGVAGWGTDQELLFFQNEGKKYKPDLTILMFYQNDLSYNNEPKDWGMYYKPLFKEIDGELVLTNVPVPKPDKVVHYDQLASEGKSVFKRSKEWLYKNSQLYNLVKERIKSLHTLYKWAVRMNLMEKQDADSEILPREYNVWEIKSNESVQAAWKITEALIKKLKEETDAVGSELLVFFIPDETGIHQEEWIKLKKKYGFSDDNYSAHLPGIILGEVCKRNGITFEDPTELLKIRAVEMEKENKRLYDPVDGHWNVYGSRSVGDILADFVNEKYLKRKDGK